MTQPDRQEENPPWYQGLGCTLVFAGIVGAAFGLGGLLGIIGNLELEFFDIALNDQRGRSYWVIGSLLIVGFGLFLARIKKPDPPQKPDA